MEGLIILVLILLFFGARRVPQLGRSLGSGIREFRKETAAGASSDDKGELERPDDGDGEEPPPTNGATARGRMPRAGEDGTPRAQQKPLGE